MFQGKLKGGLIVSVYRYDIEIVYIYNSNNNNK